MYKGNHKKVKCRCKKCDTVWDAIPSNLLKGEGCPLHRTSHGELIISNWLNKHNVIYERRKKYDDLIGIGGGKLSYDFFIPEQNELIEYQGQFHDNTDRLQSEQEFNIVLEHDRRKKEYAKTNGIKLLAIWYYKDINSVLENNIDFYILEDPVTTIV